jgi:hypothetical protein
MAHQNAALAATLTAPGASNGDLTTAAADGSKRRALYLKLFSGEMFKGFQRNTIARDLVTKRTLKNGKSLQFIFTGRTTSEYHTPGNSILGNSDNAPPVAEKTITCDDLLISSAFVYELDETLAHYDLRGEISRKIGYALAENYDRKIFRKITQAARTASPITKTNFKEPGGTQVRVGDGSAKANGLVATSLVDAFYDAAAALDEKGVSQDGRVGILSPRQYYSLIQETGTNGLINRDVQGDSLQSGNGIVEIAGIKIFKSMNVPHFGQYGVNYSETSEPDPGNKGDFTEASMANENAETVNDYGEGSKFANSCGLVFQKSAVGVVEAIGPQVQVTSGDVSVIYQGDVILGRLACGCDVLNPASAVELYAGASDATGAALTTW